MAEVHCFEVAPGLFVGSLRSLGQIAVLGITHVLSAVNFEVTSDLGGRPHLHIPLRDDEGDSLLPHLPAAIAFIQEGMQGGGKVLVHCQAGRSRSVALAVAYLMKSQGLGAQEALQQVRTVCPEAEPNEGYWSQLLLFQDMRCRLDEEHPVYRLWCLEQVGRRWEEDGCWADSDTFPAAPSDQDVRKLQVTAYRCRKCRTPLCTQQQVMPVEAAMGNRMFRNFWKTRVAEAGTPGVDGVWGDEATTHQAGAHGGGGSKAGGGGGKAGGGGGGGGDGGSSLFLEPMQWMASAVVGETQGKLYCPSCNARLGSFNWSGISNERGAWVTPAFQLHLSKLDVLEPPRVMEATAQIRRPVFGLGAAARPTAGTADPAAAAAAAAGASGAPAAAASAAQSGQARSQDDTPSPSTSTSATENGACPVQQSVGVPRFSHVVLDCDGVLVDSERASCESLRRAILEATGFDIPHNFPEDYTPVFGMDVRSCVDYYKRTYTRSDWGEVEDVARAVLEVKERHYKELTAEGIRAFPGARELIQEAQAMGLGVGIASSGAPQKIQHNLSSSGLLGLVEPQYVISASQVAKGKPAPDVYLKAMEALQCTTPGSTLVVEDAINGLIAGRAAGAFTVAVTTSLPAYKLRPHADLVVEELVEVVELLRKQRDCC